MARNTAIACSLVLLSLPLFAQRTPAPAPEGATVSGIVQTVSGSLITILDGLVTIDAGGAVIISRSGPASIDDVRPGVRIAASLLPASAPGTAFQASRVLIFDEPDGTITGKVDAVDTAAGTLTVFGLTIGTTAETRIGGSRQEMTLADIEPGDQVMVAVRATSSGLVAEQIVVQPPPPNASFAGTVKSIGAEQWVITTRDGKDVTVLITPQTRIEGSPKAGDMVQVIGNSDAAGNVVAIAIFAARPAPRVFEGVVKSIGAESWTITTRDGEDVTVLVNAQTRIDGALKVGDAVRVMATSDAAGNLVALQIAAAAPPPRLPGLTRFEGVVRSIGAQEWLVDEVRVLVTPMTRITGSPAVGDTVRVTGTRAPDGAFLAVAIEKR
ncbi:MAG TPA: DUF5666 domain-containing protein [Thermoanaerobaculia bacterium]|nr:DUF5666 domain-containing protein [Thermoanaerobaculia bacterium]